MNMESKRDGMLPPDRMAGKAIYIFILEYTFWVTRSFNLNLNLNGQLNYHITGV